MSTNVVPLKAGSAIAGIVPTSIEDVYRVATAVHKSGIAPAGMNSPEKLTVAIMHGLEIGLPPMQAIQRIAVVNGRPTLWGDAIPALLQARGFSLGERVEGAGEARVAVCIIRRPDGSLIERRFSVADAKQAGLWGKTGPWKQYPDRMLQMRARGFAARDGAADVLAGLYLQEEAVDEEATAPKSAYRARKDGDYERVIAAVDAANSGAELDAILTAHADAIDKLPRSWVEHLREHVNAVRSRFNAVDIEPQDSDDTTACRADIKTAINLEFLLHLREMYPDADWEELAPEWDAKAAEFEAVTS